MKYPEFTVDCPEGVYEEVFEVTPSQADANGEMKISYLARKAEKITEDHLGVFHMSRGELRSENKIWVISWNSIEILRRPKIGETVILRIWACKPKVGMYPRKYMFYTKDGEPLAVTAALFTLMDSVTRTMAAPSEKMKLVPITVLPNEQPLPKLIMAFPEQDAHQTERTVSPEEIDKNGHLNNTYYLDWSEEIAHTVYGKEGSPHSVWIQYNKELLEGETAVLGHSFEEGTLYVHGGAGETEAFSLIMKFA